MFAASERIFLALDFSTKAEALDIVKKTFDLGVGYKIGSELFTSCGPDIISEVKKYGADASIFLDLKFHDIPNTVSKAVVACGKMGVDFLTVHALGGADMIASSTSALRAHNLPTKVLAVTILTSMDYENLQDIKLNFSCLDDAVDYYASSSHRSGAHGIVCSPHEVKRLKNVLSKDVVFVTPGIRMNTSEDDQKRVMTPAQALAQGSDYLVIGREVTSSKTPRVALENILKSIE